MRTFVTVIGRHSPTVTQNHQIMNPIDKDFEAAKAKRDVLYAGEANPVAFHKGKFSDYSEKSLEYNLARGSRCFVPKSQVYIGEAYVIVPAWIHEKLRKAVNPY